MQPLAILSTICLHIYRTNVIAKVKVCASLQVQELITIRTNWLDNHMPIQHRTDCHKDSLIITGQP